jgi:hypothetical protein
MRPLGGGPHVSPRRNAGAGQCLAATQTAQRQIQQQLPGALASLFKAISQRETQVGASVAETVVFGYPDFYQGTGTCAGAFGLA